MASSEMAEHVAQLYRSIYAVVRRIPTGRVATYGQIAELAGIPGGARVAGAAMKVSKSGGRLPWQRVIGKASRTRGRIAIHDPVGAAVQRQLLATALSVDRCIAAVGGAGMGGIVTFTGMVRRHSHGALIDHLEYEAYGTMAVREMTRLCDEIEAEIAGTRLAVEHRVGRLGIGDIAVVIAAAAPHRAEAFTACRAMIDRLKQRVPIWKKEVGDDGAEWVGLGP